MYVNQMIHLIRIWDAICEYGDQRDYQGYIEGFNQAVQIAIDLKNKM